jgi:hypothetical protein
MKIANMEVTAMTAAVKKLILIPKILNSKRKISEEVIMFNNPIKIISINNLLFFKFILFFNTYFLV